MKIITLNINSIRARAESMIKLLKSNEYDVICIQELKCENSCFPHNIFDEYGYNIKVYGQKSWNGVAVFSKFSIEDTVRGLPTFPDAPDARFIECVIDGRIRLINVYMPNGDNVDSPKFPYKIEWMKKFGEYIAPLLNSEEPVFIGGDYNVAITDEDIWNPKGYEGSSISAPTARAQMQKWLDSGWTDAYKYFNQNNNEFTWYGYRGYDTVGNNQGLRLDYWLCNKSGTKIISDCYVDKKPRLDDKPTDHCGLVLELR